ncbi:allophanate hydrolase [Nocardioides immobilis]|uniref:Allophanate hydrolase n=1 Tax=Nocardioides immobilis TaxID=2049295 RepID=A0A417Y376_9ACTN|nr:allophanate hydrolase [Nocardioides immobilis]RHW27036.1 allophanate hydrolase [Nocardioides immobilis]
MTDPTLEPGSLRSGYASGRCTPAQVVETVLARIAARGDDGVWICMVEPDHLRNAAAALDPADRERLPLWGVPFAVKDNIDVAGMPTTAACPGFAYEPTTTAPVVERLLEAGALLVGKTNLDQFATGLNGTRSPYGVPVSVADPDLISGGSSSGSAVVVAAGLVSFAIGTDTAGSGRVPAALNGVVGLKPTHGLVSTRGIVPACRSLDCPSVFTTSVADASAVLAVLASYDELDPYARPLGKPSPPLRMPLDRLRIGIPDQICAWGARGERACWDELLSRLTGAGAELVAVPMEPFFEAGDQLYGGAWLAERLHGLATFLGERSNEVLPEIREVLLGAGGVSGVEAFGAFDRMQALRRTVSRLLATVDVLITPTVTETFAVAEMVADPVALNARLGRFTTFTNLLDLCALAVPAGRGAGGHPFGVTVQAAAGKDATISAVGAAIEALLGDAPTPAAAWAEPPAATLDLAVVGAHLAGFPLHEQLVERGAQLVARTATAPRYRLYRLLDAHPPKPALSRTGSSGSEIAVEVYRLPLAEVGGFLAHVAAPLAIGQVELADGSFVHGFVCEPWGLDGAEDITAHGGWAAYCGSTAR